MKHYKISEERLLNLLEAENMLITLEANGIDSWDWYDDANEEHREYLAKNKCAMLLDYKDVNDSELITALRSIIREWDESILK